jgi:hypothetical protein
MGVITKCCTRESIISNSQISLYSNSDIDSKEELLKEIPPNLDQNGIFQFLISEKYYSLLSQKYLKNAIVEQITKDMSITNIILIIDEILKYIINFEEENNLNIITIKHNTKCSYAFLIKEMKTEKSEEKNNFFITRALSNICIIVQSLLYLKQNEKNEIYKINIWKNKDIIKESKKNGFQGAFYLLMYKKRKDDINFNLNGNNKEKIKNEIKKEINDYYKLSIDFCNYLINC